MQIDRNGNNYWISLVTMTKANKTLSKVLSREERDSLETQLAMNPEAGKIIPNSGGIRKARFGCKGSGKSGGLRVVYFYYDLNMPLFIISAYEKRKQERYSEAELSMFRMWVQELVNEYAVKNKGKYISSQSA